MSYDYMRFRVWSDLETHMVFQVCLRQNERAISHGVVENAYYGDNPEYLFFRSRQSYRYNDGYVSEYVREQIPESLLNRVLDVAHDIRTNFEATFEDEDHCENCQRPLLEDDDRNEFDGDDWCQACYEQHLFTCEDCGDVCRNSDSHSHGDSLYCSSCYDSLYVSCENCGERVAPEDVHTLQGESLCEECYDNRHFTCEDCGSRYRRYNHDHSEDDEPLCDGCYESRRHRINRYGHKPDPIFFGNSTSVHYGVELEVNSNDDSRDIEYTYAKLNPRAEHVYLKEDGSLSTGFEIVTHPHTLAEHRKLWAPWFANVPRGLTSYKSGECGMHVHIEKSKLGTCEHYESRRDTRNKEMHIRRIILFLNDPANKHYVETIAQRSGNQYSVISEKKGLFKPYALSDLRDDRYQAVNIKNYHTVEIRIFRGTIRADRFFKNLEFVDAMVEFTRVTGTSRLTVKEFVDFVNKRKSEYRYLHNFHVEKRVVRNGKRIPLVKRPATLLMHDEELVVA